MIDKNAKHVPRIVAINCSLGPIDRMISDRKSRTTNTRIHLNGFTSLDMIDYGIDNKNLVHYHKSS